jgi:hypothetical protein
MPVKRITVAPEYVSFYVAGKLSVEIPLDREHRRIVATQDCINIPCLYWNDGDTTITLGPFDEVDTATEPAFDGMLNTPDNKIILFDAVEPEMASAHVPATQTRIRIWTNHPTEPDDVTIAWG